jgi:aryl sulfotransferase
MNIIQNGIPKSGNLWLYRILNSMLDVAGIPQKSYIQSHPLYPGLQQLDFDIEDIAGFDTLEIEKKRCFAVVRQTFREAIVDVDDYVNQTRFGLDSFWIDCGCIRGDISQVR